MTGAGDIVPLWEEEEGTLRSRREVEGVLAPIPETSWACHQVRANLPRMGCPGEARIACLKGRR